MNKDDANGIWYYKPDLSGIQMIEFDPYHGDPNKAFMAVPYDSKWTGIFNGKSKDYGVAIAHGPSPMIFVDAITFQNVDVGGATGGLHLDVLGERPAVGSDWKGSWVITSGSGDLEEIRGHGTFWGPGWLGNPEEYGVIYYMVEELEGIDLETLDWGSLKPEAGIA
jgi:hypothetical protein